MLIEKKKIDPNVAREAIEKLMEELSPSTVSLRRFVDMNYEHFRKSGKSVREIYDFFKRAGVDVGCLSTFKSMCSRAKKKYEAATNVQDDPRTKRPQAPPAMPSKIAETEKAAPEEGKTPGPAAEQKAKPRNLGLRPICLPDGTEVEIDLETGAKTFKI